jgi:hypothetical protein
MENVFHAAAGEFIKSPKGNYSYQTVADVTNTDSILFTACGASDAWLLLSDDEGSEPIEIVIGGWMETDFKSTIRIGVGSAGAAGHLVDTPGILSVDEDRPFWIRWSATLIEVGQVSSGPAACLLMYTLDACPALLEFNTFFRGMPHRGTLWASQHRL